MEVEGQNHIITIFTKPSIVPTEFQTYVINDLDSVRSSFKYELYCLRKLKFRNRLKAESAGSGYLLQEGNDDAVKDVEERAECFLGTGHSGVSETFVSEFFHHNQVK